jgi:hypothetical protein
MYFDATGALVLNLTAAGDRDSVKAAAQSVPGPRLWRSRLGTSAAPVARFRTVQYDFPTLVTWEEALLRSGALPGLTTLDVDEVENRLRLGVQDFAAASAVARRLAAAGIPEAAAIVEVVGRAVTQVTVSSEFRPVPGAVQVEEGYYGRVGTVNVNANADFGPGFITSSHGTWRYGGTLDGTPFCQPSCGDVIAREAGDGDLLPPGSLNCPVDSVVGCRYSDAAFIVYTGAVSGQHGTIVRTQGIGSRDVDQNHPRFLLNEPPLGFLMVGDVVNKIGMHTGWTQGQVTNTCTRVITTILSEGQYRRYGLLCQQVATYGSDTGDSGAPVFAWDGLSAYVDLWGIHTGALQSGGGSISSLWMYVDLELNSVVGVLDVAYP